MFPATHDYNHDKTILMVKTMVQEYARSKRPGDNDNYVRPTLFSERGGFLEVAVLCFGKTQQQIATAAATINAALEPDSIIYLVQGYSKVGTAEDINTDQADYTSDNLKEAARRGGPGAPVKTVCIFRITPDDTVTLTSLPFLVDGNTVEWLIDNPINGIETVRPGESGGTIIEIFRTSRHTTHLDMVTSQIMKRGEEMGIPLAQQKYLSGTGALQALEMVGFMVQDFRQPFQRSPVDIPVSLN